MLNLVMDNGGDTCKVGFAGHSSPIKYLKQFMAVMLAWIDDISLRVIPNYILRPKRERKLFLVDQIDEIFDFAAAHYFRPFEKVLITN